MSTRTELEQELRRTLIQAAGSVQVENGWDNLIDRINSGNQYAPPAVASPRGRERRWNPVAIVAIAFTAVVVAVGLSGLLAGPAPGTNSRVVAESAQPSEPTLVEPAPVWPPPVPTVEGQTEAAWHCPQVDPQPGEKLDPTQVPDKLRYLPAGDEPVDSAWGVNRGTGCARGPALVAVTYGNERRTAVSAVVVVWVEQHDSHLFYKRSPSHPGDTISAADGFTLRHSTDGRVDRVEAVGVIDGLPVWVESSGVTPDRLLELTAAMDASSETGRVQLTDTSNEFVVVRSNPVEAKVIDHITWYVEGPRPGQSLEITTIPEQNTYQIPVGFFPGLQLIEMAGTIGVIGGEDGGTQQLTWEIEPGIQAWVTGDYGTDLVTIAESLTLVDRDDQRLPVG